MLSKIRAAGPVLLGSLTLGCLLSLSATGSARGSAQGPVDPAKLDKYVRDACGTHPIIQVQAARRLAKSGAPGIAAIRRYIEKNGDAGLSSALVETLGRAPVPETRELLRSWLRDDSFPWPPQALRAYARIATEEQRKDLIYWSRHPAHIQRAAAMEGLGRLLAAKGDAGDAELERILQRGMTDPHPFVRANAAAQLLARGPGSSSDASPDDSRTRVFEQARALLLELNQLHAMWFGVDLAAPTRRTVSTALRKAKIDVEKGGEGVAAGLEVDAPAQDFVFGYELISCRSGDVYLRVDAEGRLYYGLYALQEIEQSQDQRSELLRSIRALPPKGPKGTARIYCDSLTMRGFGADGEGRQRWAPGDLSGDFAALEERLQELVQPLLRYRLEIGQDELDEAPTGGKKG